MSLTQTSEEGSAVDLVPTLLPQQQCSRGGCSSIAALMVPKHVHEGCLPCRAHSACDRQAMQSDTCLKQSWSAP